MVFDFWPEKKMLSKGLSSFELSQIQDLLRFLRNMCISNYIYMKPSLKRNLRMLMSLTPSKKFEISNVMIHLKLGSTVSCVSELAKKKFQDSNGTLCKLCWNFIVNMKRYADKVADSIDKY